jgi:hypothetical protein
LVVIVIALLLINVEASSAYIKVIISRGDEQQIEGGKIAKR